MVDSFLRNNSGVAPVTFSYPSEHCVVNTMVKYSKQQTSEQTQLEAQKLANHIQKPGQTKEQTRLIAQGIQKGIDLYKRQQKAKARELDKKLKKAAQSKPEEALPIEPEVSAPAAKAGLPWLLLGLSWLGFGVCFYLGLIIAA